MAEAAPLLVFPRVWSIRVKYLTFDLAAHNSVTGRGAGLSWNHTSQMFGRTTSADLGVHCQCPCHKWTSSELALIYIKWFQVYNKCLHESSKFMNKSLLLGSLILLQDNDFRKRRKAVFKE